MLIVPNIYIFFKLNLNIFSKYCQYNFFFDIYIVIFLIVQMKYCINTYLICNKKIIANKYFIVNK